VRILVLFSVIFLITFGVSAQEDAWFYLRVKDSTFQPTFEKNGAYLLYTGSDNRLKASFKNYKIKAFKKTQRNAKKENLNKTFFVIADKEAMLTDLLQNASNIFVSGEFIPAEDKKIFEPNDYGLTSTIGDSKGFAANLDYLDFLGLPQAWYYTTGSNSIIGISDGAIDTTNIDFKDRVKTFRKSQDIKGHGSMVTSIAAAKGDNGYGLPGVCYDCEIYATYYGRFGRLDYLQELSNAGAKVINCSWTGTVHHEKVQQEINEMFKNGTILVAAAGNYGWDKNQGQVSYFPASYNHVISVSSVNYKYEKVEENTILGDNGKYHIDNIRGYVGRTGGFKDNKISGAITTYPISVTSLNKDVDILAPSNGLVNFVLTLENEAVNYLPIEVTSPATPLVTGTIALMFSLYPCLPVDEVESILKMTSTNIDHIEANKPFAGKYGAGMMHTGRAVKMVFDMFAEKEAVTIENQNFNRWNFKLTSISEVKMQNQIFKEDATLNLTSKKRIVISKNTVLKPNNNGKIHLKINPTLKKECALQLRDPSIMND
jgi:hypothetical protein